MLDKKTDAVLELLNKKAGNSYKVGLDFKYPLEIKLQLCFCNSAQSVS